MISVTYDFSHYDNRVTFDILNAGYSGSSLVKNGAKRTPTDIYVKKHQVPIKTGAPNDDGDRASYLQYYNTYNYNT